MKALNIQNRTELKKRIMDLNYLSEEQEIRLSHKFKELAYSVQPSTLLRKGIHELKENIGIRNNVMRSGAGLALNLALNSLAQRNKILGGGAVLLPGKKNSFKGA